MLTKFQDRVKISHSPHELLTGGPGGPGFPGRPGLPLLPWKQKRITDIYKCYS